MNLAWVDLADYLTIAGAVLGIDPGALLRYTDLHLAESALAAPAASYGGIEFYPGGPQTLEELPLVYVVTALTALNEDERKVVDGWSDTINRAVIEAGPAGEPVKDSIPRKSRET
jgi:hypothetical protein